MRGSNLIFDYVNILYYKCHRIDFKHGGLYIDSLDWTKKKKKKKATTNPKNDNDKCFQYAATIPLKFEEIKKDSKRVMNIKPFIDNYNWEKVNYPSKIED